MKHRLPKPKLSRTGAESTSPLEQSELLVDGKKPAPESGADTSPQSTLPYSFEAPPTVNEPSTIPVSPETPSQQGNDSFNAPPPLPTPTESFTPSHSSSGYGQSFQPPVGNPAHATTTESGTPSTDATSSSSSGFENPPQIEAKAPESTSQEPIAAAKDTPSEIVSSEPAPMVEKKPTATPPPLPVKTESKATPPPLPTPKASPPPLPAPMATPTPLEVIAPVSEPAPVASATSVTTEAPSAMTPVTIIQPAATTLPPSSPANEHAPFLIQTRGLVKQYGGRRVVNGVDIHVRAGEVVGLLGKNGAGKTTTFYMIVGLVPPTEGHVYMGDEDVTRMPMYRRARRGIGYLPQEESIFRKLTVEENLLAILETLPMTEDERDARCDELLKDFGLEHVRENVTITLSGGEKRRVTIARALVTNPSLLLLDEPFSGVDPMAVHDIQEIILHLKERGLGVLITDHNVRETLSVVDRAYIIDEGRVLSEGSREFLLNDPIAREIYLGHRFSM